MNTKVFIGLALIGFATRGFAWTDGELLIWISDNRGYRPLLELGRKFEQDLGVSVKVETQEDITNKFNRQHRAARARTFSSGPTIESANGPMQAY